MPKGDCPCFTLILTCSSKDSLSQFHVAAPIVPMGEVSVMPQAWATLTPARMKRSTTERGAAEPPVTICCNDDGSGSPVESRYWNIVSHTVGTPAECVTSS